MKLIKTGILSGSFNPIHNGHLALAGYLREHEGLDEIWFMVTPLNPLKKQSDLLEDYKRLEMVQTAVFPYPSFVASDFEFNLSRPSYTINTLSALRKKYPERIFHLIIGSDNWIAFDHWKESEKIIQEYFIIVYPRSGYPIQDKTFPAHVTCVNAPLYPISSTLIREKIKNKENVSNYLPPTIIKQCIDYYQ